MDKDLIDKIRNTLRDLDTVTRDINIYLSELRQQTRAEITRHLDAANRATDARQPYLAGRQSRRDGTTYGSMPASQTEGSDPVSHDHDPKGPV
jgi:hypothetical protein